MDHQLDNSTQVSNYHTGLLVQALFPCWMYQLDKDVQIVILCPQYTSDQGDISTCIHKINITMITFDAVIYISLLMWRNSTKTQCSSKCHIIITMSKHQSSIEVTTFKLVAWFLLWKIQCLSTRFSYSNLCSLKVKITWIMNLLYDKQVCRVAVMWRYSRPIDVVFNTNLWAG